MRTADPTDETLYVGVDGGGSTCRVRVRDGRRRIRAQIVRGAANVSLDFDGAVATIAAAIGAALQTAGAHPSTGLRLGLGLAGVSSPAIGTRVQVALDRLGQRAVVSHDGDIACLGAHGGRDGGLVIAGTGSGAVARIGGVSTTIGGRGFMLGDDGSGARLGLEVVRLALRAHDGLVPHTPLTRDLMARFADDPVAAIAWGRTALSSHYAALAPAVIEAAATGDAAGLALVHASAGALVDLVEAVRRLGALRVCFVGGLSEAMRPFLPAAITDAFVTPLFDALDGALLLAGCPLAVISTEP